MRISADPIAITGSGIISAIGTDMSATLTALRHGESGIGRLRYLETSHRELPCGEVKMSNEELRTLLHVTDATCSRTVLLGLWALRQAIADAHLKECDSEGRRVVLISGTTVGGMDMTERYFPSMVRDGSHIDCLRHHDAGSSTMQMASYLPLVSESTTISTACSSAANAMILGARLLASGEADVVLAGGSEALTRFHLNGFHSLMVTDAVPCRPFDAHRGGLNLGEGAAYVVMERSSDACRRGVTVQAILSGWGNACDAYHQTATSDDGEGPYLAMREALKRAHLDATDIDYVNAHGTATENNDQTESRALQWVFGEQVPPVSSTKGFTGHTTSASGSIEAVISLLAMRHGFLPANIGWSEKMAGGIEPTMGGDAVLRHVMCNAFGFGGNDTSLILSTPEPEETGKTSETGKTGETGISGKPGEILVAARVEMADGDDLSELRRFVGVMQIRRMDPLLRRSLLASLLALERAGISTPDAIVTGTALGCLENSEQLLRQIEEEKEQSVKPTLFMQSTHNTIGSMVAIHTHCHGYNATYTHGSESMQWALRDARQLLESGACRSVLVGCHDQSTALYRELMTRAGGWVPENRSIAIVLTCGD